MSISAPKGLTICQGDEAELVASGATHYLWSTGDSSRAIYVDTAGLYLLSGIDDHGCSNIDSVRVSVNPLPKVTLKVFGKLAFCEGDSVRLQATGGQTYLWSNRDTGRVVTIKEAGVYRAFGRDTNSCEGRSDSVVVTVYANPPKPTITREGDELVSSSDTNNQWYYKGLKIDAGKGQRFPLSAEGAYSVSVTNEHGCSTVSDPYDYKKTSGVFPVFEGAWQAHVAQGTCSIVTDHCEPFEVEVVDILGRRIAMPFQGLIASEQNVELPAVPAGTYFVRVATVSRVVTLKYSN